ncbi:hypothetical protein DESUT3_38590 [Desulfuromonas versatilis]|uniref:Uncharacterized protein n=1 Tax=Desulfuromonas versatilis TaxID=2802975 RepID=A0ABN6E373_9BACT|nr:hypothetical protein [Desulfuromonas versatilis]BCR06790.1 hypothetical protein DESUT3_38590 [Desulfuromonas versatilis]
MKCTQARARGLCLMEREDDCPDYPCVYLQWAAINRAVVNQRRSPGAPGESHPPKG